ncbi:MAG: C39 family peptidase [Muribaculaceae bacterium]|nr:C39 family peptidase [Muribaculaceae bacterium]
MRQICMIILALIFAGSQAQTFRGGEIFRIGNSDVYWAAVKTTYFKDYVARQEEDCWCWAACAQMVLNYQGVDVRQEDLVRRAKGNRVNEGGTAYDIQRAADGWRTGGHVIAARVDNPNSVTAQTFIDDLIDKYPVIIGLEMPGQTVGHAYVLTGISFRNSNGSYQPIEVILRNPWPSSPSKEKLPWSEFRRRVHTIVHIYPQ